MMTRSRVGRTHRLPDRRFRALFGLDSKTTADCWNKIARGVPQGGSYRHLLWTLMFMKLYATEEVNSIIAQADRATFRKWVNIFIDLISRMNMVCIQNYCIVFVSNFVDLLAKTI